MKRLIVVAAILFSLLPLSVQAQSTPAAPCDLTAIIKEVAAFKSSKDNAKDLTALSKLQDDIGAAQAACNGLSFSGKGAKLVGPFDLPEGTYKVTATTPGYLIIKTRATQGTCDPDLDGTSIFNISSGEATGGEDIVMQSEGCRLVLEPSNVSAAWKITFEPLAQ